MLRRWRSHERVEIVQHGTTAWISGRCSCVTHDDVSYRVMAAKPRLPRMRAAMRIMKRTANFPRAAAPELLITLGIVNWEDS